MLLKKSQSQEILDLLKKNRDRTAKTYRSCIKNNRADEDAGNSWYLILHNVPLSTPRKYQVKRFEPIVSA